MGDRKAPKSEIFLSFPRTTNEFGFYSPKESVYSNSIAAPVHKIMKGARRFSDRVLRVKTAHHAVQFSEFR